MRRLKITIFVLIGLGLIVGIILFIIGILSPKAAGILIETSPESSVFIDNVLIGRTPLKEVRKPGEIVIKLVPESFEKPLVPYETKVNLVSGVETVITWEFAESDKESSGEIISFEKAPQNESSLSVVTIPDSAQVAIDSSIRAFAPYKTSTLGPGDHTLVVSAQGYLERSLKVRTYSGYKLTAVVKLSPEPETPEEEKTEEESVQGEEEEKVVEVEILSTPTGFLRVREEPSTLSDEVARVKPGERYKFIEQDEESGWFKIEYLPAEEDKPAQAGWISDTYSKLVQEEEEGPPEGPQARIVIPP